MSKIPKHAKKVFEGNVFRVYQWEQKMFDKTTKTFEIAHQQDSVSILATVGDTIVVLHQKQPHSKWYDTLPGGTMDKTGETPRQTALRELYEETGLKPKSIKLLKMYSRPSRVQSNLYLYIARDCYIAGEQELDGGEMIDVKYYSFGKFLQLSDNSHFHNKDLVIDMLQARLHKEKRVALKKLIFG